MIGMKRFLTLLLLVSTLAFAKPPQLEPQLTKKKIEEIMALHASEKTISPQVVKRSFLTFLDELDPNKTYFIKGDIQEWLEPCPELVERTLNQFEQANFTEYKKIYNKMLSAIDRRDRIEQMIDTMTLPEKVDPKKFKDLEWVADEQELMTRIMEVKSLQLEASKKLDSDLQEKSMERIQKVRRKYEEELKSTDSKVRERVILSKILKAYATSLDSHTSYFTPEEAEQFMINVQQRLFGIGAALRDDINGFRVIKIVEGGPAERGGELKNEDLIIAVDGEPVVGMSIQDAVQLIRGEENTPVTLTVIREKKDESGDTKKQTLDVAIMRGEVVLKETRYESSFEPFGDGVIAYLRLFSFYQDPEFSSASDLARELNRLKEEHNVQGVVLDLRNNSGGMLSQAVQVTGLFISKGVVVSIKDESGKVQHLRDIDGQTVWNGPLVVLINRASASASEIVAQTLQDYGRALIVGDDHSFGKGSFQTFTLNATGQGLVNPEGEYKVTRGRYYTVSGKSPQLTGVLSDIVIPGPFSESEIGEKFAKFPLDTDQIPDAFDDDLSDLPFFQRSKILNVYKFNLQPKLVDLNALMPRLKKNSEARLANNKGYQALMEEIKKKDTEALEEREDSDKKADYQLTEAYNILKDLILIKRLEQAEKQTHEQMAVPAA